MKEKSEKAGLKLSVHKAKNVASSPIPSWQIEGEKVDEVTDFISLGSKISMDGECSHEINRHLLLGRKAVSNLDSVLKSRDHFAYRGQYSQSYVFSSTYVWMGELHHKEGQGLKNWWFQAMVLLSPLDCKEIKPVNCKGNQPWIFIGWTNAEGEAPVLRLLNVTHCHSSEWTHWKRSWCWECSPQNICIYAKVVGSFLITQFDYYGKLLLSKCI